LVEIVTVEAEAAGGIAVGVHEAGAVSEAESVLRDS
jgi:hypothetical protein